jgi:2,4-dienoyl-CoA reductase-like NADH-dependent reductase (Old Yellow Enzyme family)
VTIPNRIAKAAMTEGLASMQGVPGPELERLYGLWSDGGAGLLLSGNIQIDSDHLERPGNVIIDREPDSEMRVALARWAKAATKNGNHFWAQINHAGRQTQKNVNPHPKAPSAVKLALPGGQFGMPEALTIAEIEDIVRRFALAAKVVCEAGFTGIQIHAAHGYLVSQFLSPLSNLRSDHYGGELINRARVLLDIIKAVRGVVGPTIPLSVKLNSADFQKRGFSFEDSLQVAQWLEQAGVDLIEISGGTYEQPKLLGIEGLESEEQQNVPASTMMRESYFVDFAIAMQNKVTVPLMVTGGFRKRAAMEQALSAGGVDMIGLARPLCVLTNAPALLLAGEEALPRFEDTLSLFPSWLAFLQKIKTLRTINGFAMQYWFYAQIDLLGRSGAAVPDLSVFTAARRILAQEKQLLDKRQKSAESLAG